MAIRIETLDGLTDSIHNGIVDTGMISRVYFSQRDILAARNDNVAKIDTTVFNTVPDETHELLSAIKNDDEESANVIRTGF